MSDPQGAATQQGWQAGGGVRKTVPRTTVFWTALLFTSPLAPTIPSAQESSAGASLSPGNSPILCFSWVQVMAPLLAGLHQLKASSHRVLRRRWLLPALTQHETGCPAHKEAPPGCKAHGGFPCLWLPGAVTLLLTKSGQITFYRCFCSP